MARTYVYRRPAARRARRCWIGTVAAAVAAPEHDRPEGGLLFGRVPQPQPVYDHTLLSKPYGAPIRVLHRTHGAFERRSRR